MIRSFKVVAYKRVIILFLEKDHHQTTTHRLKDRVFFIRIFYKMLGLLL